MNRAGRWPGLDGLRGIAILLVVGGHAYVPFLQEGRLGVDVFFVLSGFLITGLLLAELDRIGHLWFLGFYVRRALRLLPGLALLLVAVVVMTKLVPNWGANTTRNTAAAAFYFANIARIAGWNMGLLGHTWSLSIEEQFYLVWPMLIVASRGLSARHLAIATTLVMLAAFAWRLVIPFGDGERVYFGTDTNAASLLAGAALATWHRAGNLPRIPAWATWAALTMLLAAAVVPTAWMPGYLGVQARYTIVVGASVVLTAAATRAVPVLESRMLQFFGTISYSLYLWHFPLIMVLLYRWPIEPAWIRGLTMAGLSVGVAAASYYLVEVRFLRLKPHPRPLALNVAEPAIS